MLGTISRRVRVLGLLPLVAVIGCWGSSSNQEGHSDHAPGKALEVSARHSGDRPIKVVCTTGMVADLARSIGGSRVVVTQQMGAGVDPHTYKVSVHDRNQLDEADLILYSGLHLEGKMGDLFGKLREQGKPAFALAEYLPSAVVLQEQEGAYDPHVWFDVSLWSEVAGVVTEVLARYDPAHEAEYRQRGGELRKQLNELHEKVKRDLASVPKERRVLVTAHDAFRYFGRAYDIEVRGIQGISTEDEAGLRELNELVDFVSARKVKAVFVEDSVPPRNVQALVEGCQQRGHMVVIGGKLYSDSMGESGTPAGRYAGMVEHNVKTIVEALR